jgi:hypothetical protein
MVAAPFTALYLLFTRCREFAGGVLLGVLTVVTLGAWLQAVSWADEYATVSDLQPEQLLIYGSFYQIDTKTKWKCATMCSLCITIACLDTLSSLILLRHRKEFTVDSYAHVAAARPYQPLELGDSLAETLS